ncbi:endonuclease [Leucobacter sp. G161]|uniref:endonuclease n=1 Tax=Leucobacter sp. G161 TaxID=663704 RepID=UPI000B0D9E6F|nr:endonuclease [Leucobacter sp. G161]
MTIPLNSNGHRRRQLRARVLAEQTHCALCGQRVDKTLKTEPGKHYKKCTNTNCQGCLPHPMRPEVDEDIPRAKGGSPLQRDNCNLMHRTCNQRKGTMTLAEARKQHAETATQATAQRTPVKASPIW